MKKLIIPCLAIIILGILEGIALFKGIDGTIFTGIAALIAGIAGYVIKGKVAKSGNRNNQHS